MQPQQSLMLKVAAAAIADSRWDSRQAMRTGVLVGIGLDLNTTNFHLRWSMAEESRTWNESLRPRACRPRSDALDRRAQALVRAGIDCQQDDGVARRADRQPDRA